MNGLLRKLIGWWNSFRMDVDTGGITHSVYASPEFNTKSYHEAKPGDVKMCHMPKHLDIDNTRIYRKVHDLNCERKAEGHQCSGRITIDRNGVTLQCPLCGDARSFYAKEPVA